MAEKKYYHDIKMISSVVRDEAGNQISLTSEERLGIVNGLGGPISSTNPVVSKLQHENDIAAVKAGVKWKAPVDTVSATAPTATPTVGKRYLNSTDAKIYTCSVAGTWDVVETPEPNWTVFAKDSDEEWTYDADTTKWVMKSSGSIPYASETVSGKVTFATNGETSALKAVQGNDSRLIKGYYSTTLTNATGTSTITHDLLTSKILVQAWAGNDQVEVSFHKNDTDPTKKVDIIVNGTVASLDVLVIGLP